MLKHHYYYVKLITHPQFGIAEIKNNKIIKIVEKPKNPATNLAVTGNLLFNITYF